MNKLLKIGLVGLGFSGMSLVMGSDAVRTASASSGPSQVDVMNQPTVSAVQSGTWNVGVVTLPSTPVNVAGSVAIAGTPTVNATVTNAVNVAGNVGITGNVGLVAGTTVLADPSQVVPLQTESPGTPTSPGGPVYGGAATSGKTALVVQNANDAQQPFGVTLPLVSDGTTSMAQVLLAVPAHKRAVVERVVVNAAVPTGQQPSIVVLFGAALPPGAAAGAQQAEEQLVPTLITTDQFGLDDFVSAASVRYYVEPNAKVTVGVQWQAAPPISGVVPGARATVSGYFVDAP